VSDRPVLVYGATGYTGRLCVAALEGLAAPYLVGGRSAERLAAVAGPHCIGTRVADAADPTAAFEGVGCIISTVGPFTRYGLPVLDAAIAAGAHYTDTTAEQPFVRAAVTRHDEAVTAGVTVLPSCGVEYAPMMFAAAVLGPPPSTSYLWLDDFLPTRGSVRSMVGMAGIGPVTRPRKVRFEDRVGWAIRVPGAEEVLIDPACRAHLCLRGYEAWPFAALWPMAKLVSPDRFADRIAERVTDPTPEQAATARFTVIVLRGEDAVRIDGVDIYAATGQLAAHIALALAAGEATSAGVLAAGAALDPVIMLDRLPVSWRRFHNSRH
jgi:short subunit dehydrogenase-like uncharacterized protein